LIPQLALVDVAFNLYIHFIDCGHFAAFFVRNAMSQII